MRLLNSFLNYRIYASFAPYALNQRSPAEGKGKGQKLLAQGIALGILAISDAPCKGKSFKIHLIKIENPLRYVKLLPLQGVLLSHKQKPRALPWAMSFCPFRACCLYGLLGPLGVAVPFIFRRIFRAVWLKLPSTPFCMVEITQHALKGQKLLAQGSALGYIGSQPNAL